MKSVDLVLLPDFAGSLIASDLILLDWWFSLDKSCLLLRHSYIINQKILLSPQTHSVHKHFLIKKIIMISVRILFFPFYTLFLFLFLYIYILIVTGILYNIVASINKYNIIVISIIIQQILICWILDSLANLIDLFLRCKNYLLLI